MRTETDRLHWIRRCADSACVEVARDGADILVRDGKEGDGPILRFTREQWDSFRAGVVAGDFN